MRQLLPGLLFAALWASASAATKFGVQSADPLVLASVRFFIAGGLMLTYAYALRRHNPLPKGIEWQQLAIFALLNTTIYLGAYVIALKQVSAGIGSLGVATNPLFITLMSAVWLRRPLRWFEGTGIALGLLGVSVATYPLLQDSHATVAGLLILLFGMLSVSAATVYYARITWRLPDVVINGWQVLLGGVMLLPVTLLTADFSASHLDFRFWASVGWLIGPVSIVALQLWFYLIRFDAVRASLWLFLCPILALATRPCCSVNPSRCTPSSVRGWSSRDCTWRSRRNLLRQNNHFHPSVQSAGFLGFIAGNGARTAIAPAPDAVSRNAIRHQKCFYQIDPLR